VSALAGTGSGRLAAAAPLLLVLASTALFGTVGTARQLGPDVPAVPLGALRLVVGALGLLALAAYAGHPPRRLLPLVRRPAAWVAAVGMVGFQVAFLDAVTRTGVAVGTLVAIGSAPAFTGALSRRVTGIWLAATGVAVAGLALLVLGGGVDEVSVPGVLLALAAGFSYAAYTVAVKSLLDLGCDPTACAAAAFAMAALLLAPALVGRDLGWAATAAGAGTVFYLALVATTAAYALFNAGLRHLPARTVSTLGLAEPLIATVLGILVLDERLAPLSAAGALLVLVGLVLVARTSVRVRERQSTV
jgi:DME family drug/metabolite transporter